MKAFLRLPRPALAAISTVLLCGFAHDSTTILNAPVIVTSAPMYEPLAALRGGERFPQGARLLLAQNGRAETLVPDFAASADANVSFDGKSVLFAGKKSTEDKWQIWELTLSDRSLRKVIESATDVIRPMYLPGRRLVFARWDTAGFRIEAAELDGTRPDGRDEVRLSYAPGSAVPTDVLADGRILFEAGYPLGSRMTPELFLVYSDGSGVESYRCDHPQAGSGGRWGGHQLASGDIVFTRGGTLARFTSPLANEAGIDAPAGEYAGDIAETRSGMWLVSRRVKATAMYALQLWSDPTTKPAGAAADARASWLDRSGENLVQPVLVAPRTRPHQHPSALHDWDYANLLALDARQTRSGAIKGTPKLVRLETRAEDGNTSVLGTAPVESDGSFFVKTPADRPLRFALLDEQGRVLLQERGWFWARRGEQRICVGCHTGPERASENRVPAALMRSTTPADLSVVAGSSGAPASLQGSH